MHAVLPRLTATLATLARRHARTLLGCLLLVSLNALLDGFRFMFMLAMLSLLLIIPVQLWWLWRRSERLDRLLRIALWLLAWAAVLYTDHRVVQQREADAAHVARQIEQYQRLYQHPPRTLAEAGIDPALATSMHLRYSIEGAYGPLLFYPSALSPFDRYFYDFKQHRWDFHPD
ncbi:hypothetical protein SAMN02745857_00894 [Andreprevotia lacus DSM 23236]|jgi:ABC-type nickel/cobalt efflux system permease component RcnA|uniref:Uncharacterized protein n=1 Tax=Andreprevotia lacus DSM 23236 TaxID=1121001 RepID=A0A1W1X9F6_9NEIS|nr:hypothetical protein [Andreprevotia lacus]SMC20288.1 hypothetical protein SAMN02745857_00894 [Andreprevotia lacus DSM 23236]